MSLNIFNDIEDLHRLKRKMRQKKLNFIKNPRYLNRTGDILITTIH